MDKSLIRNESPMEYFKALVESAMRNQSLKVQETTSFYVVSLLAGYVEPGTGRMDQILGIRLLQALQTAGSARRDGLRQVGDTSLVVAGFFGDSLNRRLVDIEYYIKLGEYAYRSLAHLDAASLAEVFEDLSDNFSRVVGVVSEVSEQSRLTSNTDLLRLYEKWLRTGNLRSHKLLTAMGIVPKAQVSSRFVQ